MDGVAQFLAMGGYGVYVWPAFAVTAVVMVALVVASVRGLRREERTLEALQAARRAHLEGADDALPGAATEKRDPS